MWFFYSLLTALSWGGADLYYKKASVPQDRYSHLKIVVFVGLVMGIHGLGYWLISGCSFHPMALITYLPVSALYILSMAIGYAGLRYLELSIASPVQNTSGAVTTLLIFLFFQHTLALPEILGIISITLGLVGIAICEKQIERPRVTSSDRHYQISVAAILFPLLYCLIDGLGTFADAVYLDELAILDEDTALLAYEFTFAICAAIAYLYLRVKRHEHFAPTTLKAAPVAAILETAGQFFYVYAMADNAIIAAPLVASYSIFSVLLSRIFLKEKLNGRQYAMIILVFLGIIFLGIAEALA